MNAALRLTDRSWLLLIAVVWGLMLSATTLDRYLPGSIWFEVKQVRVFDAKAGQSPLMAVDRVVHRPFQAVWIAEVEKWDNGRFTIVSECTGRGESNYSPENDLPRLLDLDWWIFPTECKLEPGQYRIETIWRLSGGQQVRALSNIFAVTN